MKRLTLLFMLVLVLLAAAPICSAQLTFPYIFTGSPITCAPVSDCLNYAFIAAGWYGQVYENAAVTCFKLEPFAHGFQLNMFVEVQQVCTRFNTLIEAYFGSDVMFYYAPGNPYATNNIIYAQRLDGVGTIYASVGSGWNNLGTEYLYQDCYTGSQYESGATGGTC